MLVPKHRMKKVHVDTLKPIQESLDDHRYVVALLDAYTNFIRVIRARCYYILRTKQDVVILPCLPVLESRQEKRLQAFSID